ncbi:hypothetical protein H0H87_006351 [Tephrocybe sp. NHM501043]|nr:hypothetical protein H0H87_006351 [Tephrocybe sp. NHM501043]
MRWCRILPICGALTLLLLPTLVVSLPIIQLCIRPTGGEYVVALKPGVNLENFVKRSAIKPMYKWTTYNTLFVQVNIQEMTALCTRHNKDILSIEKHVYLKPNVVRVQNSAPWNLARLNAVITPHTIDRSPANTYRYDDNAGAGVDIYVLGEHFILLHVGI